jgi:hypothetical protein
MTVDPFRLAIALVPVAAYVLLLGLLNLRRRPFLTSGGCDLAALGVAVTGLIFIGPLELFRPLAATRTFGNYIWLFLVLFYWLWLVLSVLLARPRLVIYNITADELHPVLAEVAARLDPAARWAGNNLSLPALGVQLHLDSLDLMRNVALIASGGRQSLDGWRRLASDLGRSLRTVRVKSNPHAISFFVVSLALLAICVAHLLIHPAELLQAMNEVFAF